MNEITNNFTHPVILVDDRDPDTSWSNHLKRGSSGGVDLAYPYGSPVYAPADGTYQYFNGNGRIGKGSGGNIGRLRLANGDYIEFMHMAAGTKDRAVKTGDLLGKSGASGFGKLWHYGPHLHVHIYIGGVRRNLFRYFTPAAVTASSTSTPIPELPILQKEDTMKVYANADTPQAWAVGGAGVWRSVPAGYADSAIEAFGPVIKLSNVAFDLARKICNGEPYGK